MKTNNIIQFPNKQTLDHLLEESYNKAKERYNAKHHTSEGEAEAIKPKRSEGECERSEL